MDLNKAIQGRKSAKGFSNRKADWRDVIECIDAMKHAPMAGNVFSLKVIVVDNKEKIGEIAKACQQDFVSEAGYVLVVCSNESRTLNAYGKKAKDFLRQQAGAAMQNLLLKLEDKGLATCWIGYFSEGQIKNALKIPDNIDVEAIFPIGYASKKIAQRRKRKANIDSILYFNTYGNKNMKGWGA